MPYLRLAPDDNQAIFGGYAVISHPDYVRRNSVLAARRNHGTWRVPLHIRFLFMDNRRHKVAIGAAVSLDVRVEVLSHANGHEYLQSGSPQGVGVRKLGLFSKKR